MKVLVIIWIIVALYVSWMLVGYAMLMPRADEITSQRGYIKSRFEAHAELVSWPYILYDISKEEKEKAE